MLKETSTPERLTAEALPASEKILKSKFASEIAGRGLFRSNKISKQPGENQSIPGLIERKKASESFQNKDRLVNGLSRGGWTAVAVLLVLMPLLVLTLNWALDSNNQLQGYKYNLDQIRKGGLSPEREGKFVSILTSPKLQTFELQTTDALPVGSVRLYAADYKQWAVAYGGLVPVEQNSVYFLWVVRLPEDGSQPKAEDYSFLSSFVNLPGGSHYFVVPEINFPSNFAYSNFNKLIVTEEPGAKGRSSQPTGPVRFALDLRKVKLF